MTQNLSRVIVLAMMVIFLSSCTAGTPTPIPNATPSSSPTYGRSESFNGFCHHQYRCALPPAADSHPAPTATQQIPAVTLTWQARRARC